MDVVRGGGVGVGIGGGGSACTAKTQYQNFETNIPRKGIARTQSHPISTFMCL
jgi:hypothetical protein